MIEQGGGLVTLSMHRFDQEYFIDSGGDLYSTALAIFMDLSHGAEKKVLQRIIGSSYSEEDLPSNYLGFFRAMMEHKGMPISGSALEYGLGGRSPDSPLGFFDNHFDRKNKNFSPLDKSWPSWISDNMPQPSTKG